MNQQYKTSITIGLVAGFVVMLFGGWAVAVIGGIAGMGLGYFLGGKITTKDPIEAAKSALIPTLLAAGVLLVVSILEDLVIATAIGKTPNYINTIIEANLVGSLSLIGFSIALTAVHTLPERKQKLAQLLLISFVVISFPFVDQFTGLRWTAQIIFALIFTILALGLNIVVGFAGLLDLGYAAFFAIGAYTTGILSSPQHGIFLNFWIVIWIAAAVAGIFGLILGAPTLPLRGDYLAIVTLGFGEIVPVLFKNLIKVTIQEPLSCWVIPAITRLFGGTPTIACITFIKDIDLTAGEKGINPIGRPILPFIGEFQSDNPIPWYFLVIAIILLSIFIIRRLRDSRMGRAWMAIREDELAASQMGIDPVRTKLLAFAMGAMFSGFAGAFYGAYIRAIFPSVFDFSVSIIVLCMVILGGLGNINGVIVGGLVIMTADRLFLPALKDFLAGLLKHTILPALSNYHTVQAAVEQNANPILYRFLLFGLTLVIMMAVRPEGLIPSAQRKAELHGESPAEEIAAVEG
ncbi:MAG: branched-chain amino acid ABC transporter permease [Chloroflexota bacterium]